MKTLAQYLAEHGGNHEAAANALHADLTAQYGETQREAAANIRARTIAQHVQPLAEALGITLPEPGQKPTQDATAALQQGVQDAITGIQDLEDSVDSWRDLARDAGLDVDAVLNEQDDAKAQTLLDDWLGGLQGTGQRADAATQELNAYKFAHANGLNPEAVLLQKGLENLQLRDVPGKDATGKDITTKVWGIPGEGDAFTPALDHLKPVLSALKVTPSTPSGTGWPSGQESQGKSQGSAYDQYLADQQAKNQQQQAYSDPLQPKPVTPTQGAQ